MKRAFALGATILLFCTAPAASQVYPGEEVTVNPSALGHGYLLYPGGKYGRHIGNLLQPGERQGPIRLHMPVKRPRVARRAARAAPPVATAPAARDAGLATSPDQFASAPDMNTPSPAPTPSRRVARQAPPPAARPAPHSSDPGSMPEDSASRLVGPMADPGPMPAPPKPRAAAATPPKPAASEPDTVFRVRQVAGPPPRRVASATPPPANTTPPPSVAAGLRKQSSIPFAPGASSPAGPDVNAVHTLATALNAAINSGAQHVQLNAYGGPRGDKSSDAHRLALKRALVIRELLIEDGVPAEKIDVRALGGADDSGPADRVDVFVGA
ncbi:MAG: hypothetical protein WDN01_12920 [Rhizomicrobium sp.]